MRISDWSSDVCSSDLVVGSLEGDVIALDAGTGAERWRATVENEVIAAPAVGQGMAFLRSNDGRVTAFDAATGERRRFWATDIPLLPFPGHDAPPLGPRPGLPVHAARPLPAIPLSD